MNYEELKEHGFLRQRQQGYLIKRFRSVGGNLTAGQLRELADLAERYGKGFVHLTTRQGVEVSWVPEDRSAEMLGECQGKNLLAGVAGLKIRTVVACPGTDVCRNALLNSSETAKTLDRVFVGRKVPYKTKIAVSGCPNSCAKPQENDIGLTGVTARQFSADSCTGCGLCVDACPGGALSLSEEGFPQMEAVKCRDCGKCSEACPSEAWRELGRGYRLSAGGKVGRRPRLGTVIAEFIPAADAVKAIEAVLAAFAILQQPKERIGDTLDRVGVNAFRAEYARALENQV